MHQCNCTEIEEKCGKPCCTPVDCSCKVEIGSECWTYTGDDLECSGIKKDTVGTELIQQLDAFICAKFDEVQNFFSILNVGSGAEVYKGMDLMGKKLLRSITKTGDLIQITQSDDEINITIDESELTDFVGAISSSKTYSINNESDGAEIYKDSTILSPTSTQFNLRTLKSTDGTVQIVQGVDDIELSAEQISLDNGDNTTVTGTGTTINPYKINVDGSETKINNGTNTTVTGTGTTADPYIINAAGGGADGSETKVQNGTYTTVSGNGTVATPYEINVLQSDVLETSTSSGAYIQNKNPTKTVTLGVSGSYTVVVADNNYVIEIDNGANDVTIDLAGSLGTNNFFVGFVQKGTGNVLFSGQDIIPVDTGNYLYGQGHIAALEIIGSTKYLHGTLKTI